MSPFRRPIAVALALLAAGCNSQLEVSVSQDGCTDFSYTDPAPPELQSEVTGPDSANVWRANVLLNQAGATFAPELAIEHGTLSVIEHWTDPASDDTFCYAPMVTITSITGTLEVDWYTEDDLNVPFERITVDP